jgi:F0F1-type ATP synthase delta subunit
VDPDLVGGLYVRIGDRVMDRSMRGLLQSLQDRLFAVSLQSR